MLLLLLINVRMVVSINMNCYYYYYSFCCCCFIIGIIIGRSVPSWSNLNTVLRAEINLLSSP